MREFGLAQQPERELSKLGDWKASEVAAAPWDLSQFFDETIAASDAARTHPKWRKRPTPFVKLLSRNIEK